MAGLNQDQWVDYMRSRLIGYVVICAYNVVGVVGNVALIAAFGAGAALPLKVAMAFSIIAVAAVSILPAMSVFDDMKALRADRLAAMEGSAFMANYDASPIGLYSGITVAFNAVLALVQLWALFSI